MSFRRIDESPAGLLPLNRPPMPPLASLETAMTRPDTRPDVLGGDWLARTLPLTAEGGEEVVATLVHRDGMPRSRRAVLYVHGYCDYFFQTHLAERWEALGFDVHALDLRRYGRSLRPWQIPNFCTDLAVYDEELDAAVAILRQELGYDRLVVMAHSTGGLVTALWADRRRGRGQIDAMVMNSPWFDLAGGWLLRGPVTAAIDVVGALSPTLVVSSLGPHYGRSIHRSGTGEWDYDLTWKPIDGFPVRAGWFRAIRRGHAALAAGLAIDAPVLVCCSTASGPNNRWHDAITRTDSVLDVAQIVARAPCLGPMVTVERIADGIHDLSLSAEPARSRFFDTIADWIGGRLPPN